VQASDGVEAITLQDPTLQSVAAYGAISVPGEQDIYRFTPAQDAKIPVEALVPARVSNRFFAPDVVVASTAFPAGTDVPVAIPEGWGAVLISSEWKDREVYFEEFSQERLYHGVERMLDVHAGNTYLVYIFDDERQTGDYALGIGSVENFDEQPMSTVLAEVFRVKAGTVSNVPVAWTDVLGLFLAIAGFVIGLGAVSVIDVHGFLARRSAYWTQATIRTHYVTKPLIWIGMLLAVVGTSIYFSRIGWTNLAPVLAPLAVVLVLNGAYLSFVVSPQLQRMEKTGKEGDLVPRGLQRRITVSFLVSFFGWWSALFLLVWQVVVLR